MVMETYNMETPPEVRILCQKLIVISQSKMAASKNTQKNPVQFSLYAK